MPDAVALAAVVRDARRGLAGVAIAQSAVPDPTRDSQRAAGETALAAALALLDPTGVHEAPTRSQSGRPRLTDGLVGSIAHRDGLAVAVATRRAHCRTVGVDLERDAALPLADAALVLSEREHAAAAAHAAPDVWATLTWSAKEAAFKAWCHALDADLDGTEPTDVVIELQGDQRFAARALGRVAAAGAAPLVGRWWRADGWVLSVAAGAAAAFQSTASTAIA